jgi:hypothetical protein
MKNAFLHVLSIQHSTFRISVAFISKIIELFAIVYMQVYNYNLQSSLMRINALLAQA